MGDAHDWPTLLSRHRRLIAYMAWRTRAPLHQSEKIQAAAIALVAAAGRHSPSLGPFLPYAKAAMRNGIWREAAAIAYPTRVPVYVLAARNASARYAAPRAALSAGRLDPTPATAFDEIADLGATPECALSAPSFPLPAPRYPEGIYDTAPPPDAALMLAEDRSVALAAVRAAMARLGPAAREMVEERFGFRGAPSELAPIAARLGVSQQAVSVALRVALRRMGPMVRRTVALAGAIQGAP